MPDRYLCLDRLQRHTEAALDRIDRKLDHHRTSKAPDKATHITRLRAMRAKLELTLAYERGRIETHIKNWLEPPIRKPKRLASKR